MWLSRDPAHSAHGFGQQVASLVLWFGSDDWVIDQTNRGATRMQMPSPCHDTEQIRQLHSNLHDCFSRIKADQDVDDVKPVPADALEKHASRQRTQRLQKHISSSNLARYTRQLSPLPSSSPASFTLGTQLFTDFTKHKNKKIESIQNVGLKRTKECIKCTQSYIRITKH